MSRRQAEACRSSLSVTDEIQTSPLCLPFRTAI
jgi:hypothetical protein